MGRPRGERGIQKLPIVAFHKNFKLNLVFILILRDTYIDFSLSLSFFFCRNWKKWNNIKNKRATELQFKMWWLAWKNGVYVWFLIPYFRSDPKVNTYSKYLLQRLIDLLTDWLPDQINKWMIEWMNACLFNALLIFTEKMKEKKSIFLRSPDFNVPTKDHIWWSSFYYRWRASIWLPSGH